MNKKADPLETEVANATHELARIQDQTLEARAELARVHKELLAAQSELGRSRAARLVEANEQLVLATLSAQKAAELSALALKEAVQAAELDPLTQLPNRALLRARLALAISSARQSGGQVALLMLDITDFRQINDALGHAVGDQVLQHAAHCLSASMRAADTISRHGTDEFLILLPDVSGVAGAVEQAEVMIKALSVPIRMGEHVLRLSASVGISLYPDDGEQADSLIDRAVAAMYRAKWGGVHSFAFRGEDATSKRSLELRTLESLRSPLSHHTMAVAEQEGRQALLQEANTQLVLAALNAQQLQAAAENAQRRHTDFLGVLAHELRNPLTPMRNAAAILERIPGDSPHLAVVQSVIKKQVGNMSRLIGDLLDVSRVNTGKLRLEFQKVEMLDLIDEVVSACRPAMDTRLQQFHVQLPPRPLHLNGDPLRLTQVLTNLLDNASKYTPEGGTIRLTAVASADRLVLTVSDSGIGITPEALPNIFEPFVQDAHATVFNNDGLGIGLTVVRELVHAHGGQIVASSAGKTLGSQFCVTLALTH